ncbi:hypothetical protein CORC01_09138 [Colletotrichum orchidophilum]|uniref:Uncharacterized protein n=1 Tax=Colletotrichum orchidophilum TaxID=1209926 RepID=A0A1G4B295_9PEZI|nr:uncharacterized protein CORC01_09138 [Colletotrichum orchidophilum]OHE95548.1 hypothetical protein CORC01_09138 [Colletotrichum orchidophilum]
MQSTIMGPLIRQGRERYATWLREVDGSASIVDDQSFRGLDISLSAATRSIPGLPI